MTRERLNRVRNLREVQRQKENRLRLIKESLQSIIPIRDGQPHANKHTPKIEELTIKQIDLEREIAELAAQIETAGLELLGEIICNINLTDKEHEVLVRRYVFCSRFRDIQFMMKLSDARVFAIHSDAVKKILGKQETRVAQE